MNMRVTIFNRHKKKKKQKILVGYLPFEKAVCNILLVRIIRGRKKRQVLRFFVKLLMIK